MKTKLAVILSCTMTFTACVEKAKEKAADAGSLGNGVILAGTAATGAPVSNGNVIIKDKHGDSPSGEIKTDRQGKYSANVDNLEAPFLIHITSPSGEKLISVANQSDVRNGKKVNVTPLSHIVAANVFEVSDPDELLENFVQTASSKYSDDNLANKKKDLQAKLASVMTALNVSSSTDIMNGELVAGSGAGLDKVLDAIKIKVDTADIKVSFKGSTEPIITTSPSGTTVDAAKVASGSAAITAQLSTLEQIKTFLKNASTEYNAIVTQCAGPAPVDVDDVCHPQKLYDRMEVFLHEDYKWQGLGKNDDLWEWFCTNENDDEVASAADCTIIKDKAVEFSDVTIVSYDSSNGEATITMNMYQDGQLRGFEVDYLKKDGNAWTFYGNQQDHRIWIGPQSVIRKKYSQSSVTKSYEAKLSMHIDQESQPAFVGATEISIVAVDKDNNPVTALNQALATANNYATLVDGGIGLDLDTSGQVMFVVPAKTGINYQGDFCDLGVDSDCYFNWESNNLSITAAVLPHMEQNQKFLLRYRMADLSLKTDVHYVTKPLILSASTEAKYAPFFEDEGNLCTVSRDSYLVSAPAGSELNWANVMFSWQTGEQTYIHARGEGQVEGLNDSIIATYDDPDHNDPNTMPSQIPVAAGEEILWSHFYLSSDDAMGRQFTKQISCQN